MKTLIRLVGAIAVGVSLLITSTALAEGGHGGGGHGGGGYGGYRGDGWYGGWGRGYPVVAFGFGGPYYNDNYAPAYYDAQALVVYSSPTVNFNGQPVVYNSPPADYNAQPTTPTPVATTQNPPAQPNSQQQPMTVADIKTLAKGGLSEQVILSQIRSHHAVFHLTTAEIIELNDNKVSQKVIEFMISTASPH